MEKMDQTQKEKGQEEGEKNPTWKEEEQEEGKKKEEKNDEFREAESRMDELLRQARLREDKEALRGDYGPAVQFIIQGNYVSNTGTIHGGVSQQQDIGETCALAVVEDTGARVQRFFSEGSLYTLSALITLACLQRIPENKFHEVVQALSGRLAKVRAGEDQGNPDRFQTAKQLLEPFPIQRQTVSLGYGAVYMELTCLSFQWEDLAGEIRQQIWQDYPQIRSVIMEWLFWMRTWTADAVCRFMSYSAMQCLAAYASLDLVYARSDIIPFLEQNCVAQSDVKYMVVFVDRFMQEETCKTMADDFLCRWCNKRRSLLWQVPYRLYGREGKWRFLGLVSDSIRREIEEDLSAWGSSGWYRKDRGYLLYPAHQNPQATFLLARELGKCFAESRKHQERRVKATYFISLLRWDYLMDFAEHPEMVFLRCFHRKAEREAILPLMRFLWQYADLRQAAWQILTSHMAELGESGETGAYLEKPFEYLAFTGSSFDYKIAWNLLNRCARDEDARPIAKHLANYLSESLKRRATALEE